MTRHGKNLLGFIGTGMLTLALGTLAFAVDDEIAKTVAATGACLTGIMNIGCCICGYKTSMQYYNSTQREREKYKESVDSEMENRYPSSPN
jgi:hypothetical protein